jgi:hypothetical protein
MIYSIIIVVVAVASAVVVLVVVIVLYLLRHRHCTWKTTALGYTPAVTILSYYEDGEDAYYMQKLFGPQQKEQHVTPEGQRPTPEDGVHDTNDRSLDEYQLRLAEDNVNVPEKKRDDNNNNDNRCSDSVHSNNLQTTLLIPLIR